MVDIKIKNVLQDLFYNVGNESAFGSVLSLYKAAKKILPFIRVKDVKEWVKSEETYGVHFPFKSKYPRSRIISAGIDYMWEMDLMDMQKLSRYNGGYRYVILVIDVFSRYVWTEKVKNKKGYIVLAALKSIFQHAGRKPEYIRSDKGSEFVNKWVKEWLAKNHVEHILTNSEVKAALAERAIKTVKGKLFKYMYHYQKWRYIDILQIVTETYNKSFHSSIGMSPVSVNKKNEKQLWWKMYVSMEKIKPVRLGYVNVLKPGLFVHISFLRGPFDREYRQKWSSEIFQIYQRFARDGILVYMLRDLSGEKLSGSFYREELQEVKNVTENLYKIEKILRKKKESSGKYKYFVKWLNWDRKFNSWVNEDDVMDLHE